MQYTIKNLLTVSTTVAVWVACVSYGVSVSGSGGGVLAGIASGIAILFICGAIWCNNRRRYAAAAFLLTASLVTATYGYFFVECHAIFSAQEIKLSSNLRHLTRKLRENSAFKNVELRIQREAIGGCIILTGVVDSKEQVDSLNSICALSADVEIENRVRIGAVAK